MSAAVSQHQSTKRSGFTAVSIPNKPDNPASFDNDTIQGFIKHPERFPLNFRRLRFWERSKAKFEQISNVGLTFFTQEYQKPGNILEITIPTRKETHQFLGKVVMVKESENGYEIGVWLLNVEDGPKLRIIEQICHIELYLNDKRYADGPFLSKERLTEEWVTRFASRFPVS
ncbi:MAG: PilZ domain-containing protein [Proteobacteria bacterium]|nr:PilZ domain-containing protein [Pseudomonadota bacterium]